MSDRLPLTQPVASLSPSALALLQSCPLRLAFQRSVPRTRAAGLAPQQLLGTLCHAVLEQVVKDETLLRPTWERALDDAWAERIAALPTSMGAEPPAWMVGPPQTWPGYAIKRARLGKAARRLRELLASAEGAELVSEQELVALTGRLRGYPDLVVRGQTAHWIVDYKTGEVLSQEDSTPRDSYVRQLQLYAVLEREASGSWPTRAYLLPLLGAAVEVAIDPEACEALADQVIRELETYNEMAGTPPEARPSPAACAWCEAATRCPAIWEHADESWADGLLAAEGEVTEAVPTRLGGMSLVLRPERGSLAARPIAVRGISLADHPDAALAVAGATARLVALRRDREGDAYTLHRWGRLAVMESETK